MRDLQRDEYLGGETTETGNIIREWMVIPRPTKAAFKYFIRTGYWKRCKSNFLVISDWQIIYWKVSSRVESNLLQHEFEVIRSAFIFTLKESTDIIVSKFMKDFEYLYHINTNTYILQGCLANSLNMNYANVRLQSVLLCVVLNITFFKLTLCGYIQTMTKTKGNIAAA